MTTVNLSPRKFLQIYWLNYYHVILDSHTTDSHKNVNVTMLVMLCFVLVAVQLSGEDIGLVTWQECQLWLFVQSTIVTSLAVRLLMDIIIFLQYEIISVNHTGLALPVVAAHMVTLCHLTLLNAWMLKVVQLVKQY